MEIPVLCEYSFEIVATCPVDKKPDVYRCTVRSQRTIPVEEILKAVEKIKEVPLFQEDLTSAIHRVLAAEVETVGHHSGVRTRVICGGTV